MRSCPPPVVLWWVTVMVPLLVLLTNPSTLTTMFTFKPRPSHTTMQVSWMPCLLFLDNSIKKPDESIISSKREINQVIDEKKFRSQSFFVMLAVNIPNYVLISSLLLTSS